MLTPAIVCLLCGLFLGWRFEVGAAAGASLIALLATLFYGISQGSSLWFALLSITVNVTTLQMGYLGACAFIRRAKREGAAKAHVSDSVFARLGTIFPGISL